MKPAYSLLTLLALLFLYGNIQAQFIDEFNGDSIKLDREAINGWAIFTGDGNATIDLKQGDGYGSILIDATKDRRNIWWAVIRRHISANMDLSLISKPGYEFRIEAKIKVSHAPRRVNLHLNTQRTTDFHSHLMEFDIPDTSNWHTISMTTKDFDARPGDHVYGQLAVIDWGLEKYRVNVDYFRVDIVDINSIGPDKGAAVPYHPQIPPVSTFKNHIPVEQDAMLDAEYPDMNFSEWSMKEDGEVTNLLTVNASQITILRWDLSEFAGMKTDQAGLLELTTHSVQKLSDKIKDFGMIRIVEILGGAPDWTRDDVTYNSFLREESPADVLNSQMIIDVEAGERRGSKNLITISQPVLQRLIDGKTLGLAIRPLGAISAAFSPQKNSPIQLHFNTE